VYRTINAGNKHAGKIQWPRHLTNSACQCTTKNASPNLDGRLPSSNATGRFGRRPPARQDSVRSKRKRKRPKSVERHTSGTSARGAKHSHRQKKSAERESRSGNVRVRRKPRRKRKRRRKQRPSGPTPCRGAVCALGSRALDIPERELSVTGSRVLCDETAKPASPTFEDIPWPSLSAPFTLGAQD
jgi:hypothetical protein